MQRFTQTHWLINKRMGKRYPLMETEDGLYSIAGWEEGYAPIHKRLPDGTITEWGDEMGPDCKIIPFTPDTEWVYDNLPNQIKENKSNEIN